VSATSRSNALAIVANVRNQYQACVTANVNLSNYNKKLAAYNKALAAYDKRYHIKGAALARNKSGKVIARPPAGKPTGSPPQVPADCPAPVPASSGGSS
jgi:hypothetical protein